MKPERVYPAEYGLTETEDRVAEHFALSSNALLVRVLDEKVSMERVARAVLAARGVDNTGRWVGFEAAAVIHGIGETK